MNTPNNQNAVEECRTEGFSIIPGFLTLDNLAVIHGELRHLAEAFGGKIGLKFDDIPDAQIDRAFVQLLKLRPEWQSILYQRIQQVPSLLASCSLSQVQSLAQDLLKTESLGIWPRMQVRLDLFEDQKNHIRWHHDYMYNRGTQSSFTYWIPLTSFDSSMGLLQIARKSHINADDFVFEKIGDLNKFDYNLSDDQVAKLDLIIPQSYEPGDLVVFHSKTIHSGALNTNSERARLTLLFRIQNLHDLEDI